MYHLENRSRSPKELVFFEKMASIFKNYVVEFTEKRMDMDCFLAKCEAFENIWRRTHGDPVLLPDALKSLQEETNVVEIIDKTTGQPSPKQLVQFIAYAEVGKAMDIQTYPIYG